MPIYPSVDFLRRIYVRTYEAQGIHWHSSWRVCCTSLCLADQRFLTRSFLSSSPLTSSLAVQLDAFTTPSNSLSL